jgi:hypothetical protein
MVISQLLSVSFAMLFYGAQILKFFLLEPSGPTKNKNHIKIGHNDNSSISYWAEPSLPAGIYVGDQNLPSGLGWQSAYEKC